MNVIKKLALCALVLVSIVACEKIHEPTQWEYKVVQFDRDEKDSMQSILDELGIEGWEYAGGLANNGINAQYVAFKRPIRK